RKTSDDADNIDGIRVQQLGNHVPLSDASSMCELEIDQQSVALLHQRVTQYASLASNPRPFLANRASGSVVLWCVKFERFSPRKLTVGLPGSSGAARPRVACLWDESSSDS